MTKNRGMFLETLINKTIRFYKQNNVALFHKLPLNIKFKSVSRVKNKLFIEKGFIDQKSNTDYYGVYKGRYIAFEAKSTQKDVLPFSNLKAHQQNYLREIDKHGGVAFYIVAFTSDTEFFLIDYKLIDNLSKKQLSIVEARKYGFPIELEYPGILDFIPIVNNEY